MNIKQVYLLRQFLVTQFNHWSYFSLAVGAMLFDMYYGKGLTAPAFLGWAAFGAVPFLQYCIRERIRNFWYLSGLHLLLLALPFFLPITHLSVKAPMLLCGVVYFIHSMRIYFSEIKRMEVMLPLSFSVGCSAVLLICLHHVECTEYDGYYIVLLSLLAALYLIGSFVDHYLDFIQMNESSAGYMADKEIFRSGLKTTSVYAGVGVLFLLAVSRLSFLDPVVKGLKQISFSLLKFLIRLLLKDKGTSGGIEQAAADEGSSLIGPVEPQEVFWLWELLEKALYLAVLVILLYLLWKAVLAFIKFVRSLNAKSEPEHDVIAVTDVRERLSIRSKAPKNKRFRPSSMAERIRKQFRRRLLTDRKLMQENAFFKGELSLHTAREYASVSGRDTAAALYEKARYSDLPCSKEDLKSMKEACK